MSYQKEVKNAAKELEKSGIDIENQEACWDFVIQKMPDLNDGGEDINPVEEFFIDVMECIKKGDLKMTEKVKDIIGVSSVLIVIIILILGIFFIPWEWLRLTCAGILIVIVAIGMGGG